MEQLREQGISDLAKVKEAYIESDGQISVVESKEKHRQKREKRVVKKAPVLTVRGFGSIAVAYNMPIYKVFNRWFGVRFHINYASSAEP